MFHALILPLKDDARANKPSMRVTEDVSKFERLWLNDVAASNIEAISTTADVWKLERSPLKLLACDERSESNED